MLEFTRLGKQVNDIKDYLLQANGFICDISLGVRYMWRDEFAIEYAVYNDTLIMKEDSPGYYSNAFYYPIGKDEDGALTKIEEYCRAKNLPLSFCCLDNEQAANLSKRYAFVHIANDRDWSDYIYDADKFKTYSGKKNSGQRNHVNKFKKLYPNYQAKVIDESDFLRIKEFLVEYNGKATFSGWEEIESKRVFELVENMFELNQGGVLLEIDGKVVAFSLGERVGNTLIVHIEKALTRYEGVYPTMAQEFAKAFAVDGVKYINREEDCGDAGLRISKLQYHPIQIQEKNVVTAYTLFDKLSLPVIIKTPRLTISEIEEKDAPEYQRLYLDEKINKWWGYDYREDLKDGEPTAEYFYSFQKKLKENKEEISFAVKLEDKLIGELVLHNFDYFDGVEIGFRFFSEYQGKGYALESAFALKEFVLNKLNAQKIKSRCFKENLSSRKLIERLGLKLIGEDSTHYHFEKI